MVKVKVKLKLLNFNKASKSWFFNSGSLSNTAVKCTENAQKQGARLQGEWRRFESSIPLYLAFKFSQKSRFSSDGRGVLKCQIDNSVAPARGLKRVLVMYLTMKQLMEYQSVFNISFSPKGLKRLIFKKQNKLSTPY